jgi:multidrug efflux pump subunit AcrB
LERTRAITAEVEKATLAIPGVETTLAISGVNILTNASRSDAALLVVKLKPWDERKAPELGLRAILKGFMAATRPIAGARVIPFNPPPIPGLSNAGGFAFMLQDQASGFMLQDQASGSGQDRVANEFMEAARKRPEIGQIFSKFNASTPSLRFEVDRYGCLGSLQVLDQGEKSGDMFHDPVGSPILLATRGSDRANPCSRLFPMQNNTL